MLKPIPGMKSYDKENKIFDEKLKKQIAKEDAAYASRKASDSSVSASPSQIISDGSFIADHEWVDGKWMEV